ncbi:MAG: SWIM zinc finger family protein [Cyanobacteria bacterium J06641_5]
METANRETAATRQWWVLQWLDLLEKYRFKKRLERGRNYAKEGNVLSIEFSGTQARARVQGTADEPYDIEIGLDAFSDEDWDHAIATLAAKATYAAQLLAGQMPADIEAVFTTSGLSLFPFTLTEVRSRCSCPDPKNPCKHVAAVYYLLGDRFSEDPFVLFQLRGRTREQVLAQIRQQRSRACQGQASTLTTAAALAPAPAVETTGDSTLSRSTSASDRAPTAQQQVVERFWRYREPLEASLAPQAIPTADVETSTEAVPLTLLGDLPLPDAPALRQYFERAYARIRQHGQAGAAPPEDKKIKLRTKDS